MNNPRVPSPNPVFIVTGASRGYGLAIVKQLYTIAPNCHVLGTARSGHILESLYTEFPKNQWAHVSGDITHASVAQACVSQAIEMWGRLDGIVHNAGVLEPIGPLGTIPIADFRNAMEVNVTAVLQLTQFALPYLRACPSGTGRMILVSSGAATHAYQGWVPYCTSKAALNMLAKTFAIEEPGIVTISLRPGVLDTDMQDLIRTKGKHLMDSYQFFVDMHKDNKLTAPSRSGHVAAQLLVNAPKEFSGEFLDWQDLRLAHWQMSQ